MPNLNNKGLSVARSKLKNWIKEIEVENWVEFWRVYDSR
jgi:hypothetical protein